MTFLLDVNVLIALIDPTHVFNRIARDWFVESASSSWATCPITENGALRIVGDRSYPNSPGSTAVVASTLGELCDLAGHMFWPDDISLLGASIVEISALTSARQVTDTYLLALAARRGGQLATFDRRLSTRAVPAGDAALHIISS